MSRVSLPGDSEAADGVLTDAVSNDAVPTDASFVAAQPIPREHMRSINRHSAKDPVLIVHNRIYKVFMPYLKISNEISVPSVRKII